MIERAERANVNEIGFVREGEGSPVFVLPGFLEGPNNYLGLRQDLRNEHEVITLNCGVSGIEETAGRVVKLANEFGFERFGLEANSIHTFTALTVGAQNPQRVDYLTLGGTPYFEKPIRDYIGSVPESFELRDLFNQPGMKSVRDMLGLDRRELRKTALDFVKHYGRKGVDTLREIMAFDCMPIASQIEVPVLVVEGAETNPLISMWNRLGEAIKNSRVELIPEAGHPVVEDQTNMFIKAFREFTEGLKGEVSDSGV